MIRYKELISKLISIQPFLVIMLALTSVGLFTLNVIRGEHIMDLQSELLKQKDQQIKVIIEGTAIAERAGSTYTVEKNTHEVRYEQVKGDMETIIKENTVFLNVCIPPDGVQRYNEFVSSTNAKQPSGELQ